MIQEVNNEYATIILIACGGDTAETTEVVNTTATVTEDGIEVVETTTTEANETTEDFVTA